MNPLAQFLHRTRVAYFSMEIALRPEMHTYAGGLGVLAGDTARSAADLNLPMVFVSLVSRRGYVRQEITPEGTQIDHPNPWAPEDWAEPLSAMVAVPIAGRDVWIRPWLYLLSCPLGHSVPVILLDTDLEQNGQEDRAITDRLYGGDDANRLKQEMVLGIGGMLLLRALGFNVGTYHLNEGHAALLTLQLFLETGHPAEGNQQKTTYDRRSVRERCVFTTHTPVEAGFDRFDYGLINRLIGEPAEIVEMKDLAGAERFNMTQLALTLSGYVNGVAQRHAETARRMFPDYGIRSITNGVHPQTWTHRAFARLYDARFPNWAHEPEVLALADQIPDQDIWEAHDEAKAELLVHVHAATGVQMRLDIPTIGFARRMTGYKRPDLLFSDVDRLRQIALDWPFQVVVAGLAHPSDNLGKQLIADLCAHIRQLNDAVPIAFVPGYDIALSAMLTSGCDIWLNTPMPPLEASGTSGMKAALNGGLNLSVLDGWWVEGCVDGITGWPIIGNPSGSGDSAALYDRLELDALPLYHDNRSRWIWMMKQAISKLGPVFNSQRMMRRYATEAYIR